MYRLFRSKVSLYLHKTNKKTFFLLNFFLRINNFTCVVYILKLLPFFPHYAYFYISLNKYKLPTSRQLKIIWKLLDCFSRLSSVSKHFGVSILF